MASIAITKVVDTGRNTQGGIGTKMAFTIEIPAAGWLAAGNPIDLTDYFSEIKSAQITSRVASTSQMFQVQHPTDGTAITSANVLLFAYNGATVVADDTDLSGNDGAVLVVEGKVATDRY